MRMGRRRVPALGTLAGLVIAGLLAVSVVSCGVGRLLGITASTTASSTSSGSAGLSGRPVPSPSTSASSAETVLPIEPLRGPYDVVRVVDGDTVRVAFPWGEESIRLIGIDTPETVHPTLGVECFGPEASENAKNLMTGTAVWIEYDESQGQRDRYDRLLAYIWLTPTQIYNLRAVREGFATEYTYDSAYAHRESFLAAQTAARSEGRGLWGACSTP